MTCFWDSILASLNEEDFLHINEKRTNNIEFIKLLQKHNIETANVVWNDEELSKNQLKEKAILVVEAENVCEYGSIILPIAVIWEYNFTHSINMFYMYG